MSRRAVIAGVALSGVGEGEGAEGGRVGHATPYALAAQAARRALADAGLRPSDVDGLGSTSLGTLPPVDMAEYLGLRPRWIDSTSVGGASWEVMAAHAADAIAAGHADVVLLTYGSTARSDLRRGLRTASLDWGSRGPQQWEAPYGHTLISKYAMAARRHMHEYGTTIEQLAEIAVSARANAATNPEASFRDPITVDDVLSGPVIADPFTKLQCCIRSDGGAAAVIVAEDRAADLPKAPVHILGTGEYVSHMATSQWPDFTTGPAAVSGPLAFERAGVRPRTSTCASCTTRSPTCSSSPWRTSASAPKARRGPSSRREGSGTAASCPPTPTAADCPPVILGSAACSSSSRRYASCAGSAVNGRCPTPSWPA